MNRTELTTTVINCLSEVLKTELPGVTEQTRLFDDLHLDSTAILELLMSVEEAVDVEFDTEELNMDDFQTVGTLVDSVYAAEGVTVS
jgi:acyl carrier protein